MRAFALVLMFGTVGCVPRLYGASVEWEMPENTWPIREPPSDLAGIGWGVGDVPMDFRLVDQFGDTVSLWQFYGSVVLVDVSTMWCAPCQDLARHTEETWQDYRDQGFVYVTALQEDVEGGPPGPEGVELWVEGFDITAPVLDDGSKEGTGTAIQQGQFPAVLVLDRQMRVAERVNPVSDEAVRAAIEDLL